MKVWIIVMCKLKFCGTKWIMFENTKEVFCTMWSDSISQYLGMIFFSVSVLFYNYNKNSNNNIDEKTLLSCHFTLF